jgi:HlyD family secretion protein
MIDPALFQAKVAETRARFGQTSAEVHKARANLSDAENDSRRFGRLWKDNLVAKDEYDNAYTRYLGAKADLAAAQGQTVAASFQTPTLFTIAQDLTEMPVEVAVDEGEVGKVQEGQQAAFTVDAYPGTAFSGKVTTVRLAPDHPAGRGNGGG